MDATDASINSLHTPIVDAARAGATYQWIAGVLAGSLSAETTTTEARAAAIRTLACPPVRPVRQRTA